MAEVAKHLSKGTIEEWAGYLKVSAGTLCTIRARTVNTDDSVARLSYEYLISIMMKIKGCLKPVLYIDSEKIALTGERGELSDVLIKKFKLYHETVPLASMMEMERQTGIHRPMIRALKTSNAVGVKFSVVLDNLVRLGHKVQMGLEESLDFSRETVSIDLGELSLPNVTIVNAIRTSARANFEQSGLNIGEVIRLSKQDAGRVRDFLRGPLRHRQPLVVALAIAKACGGKITLTIN